MRRFFAPASLAVLVLALVCAGAASAAQKGPKDLYAFPGTRSPIPGLRGEQDVTPVVAAPTSPLAQAGLGQSRLTQSGLPVFGGTLASKGLASLGLAPAGDPAPACRSQCSVPRLSCSSDDDGCDARWTACIATCAPAP